MIDAGRCPDEDCEDCRRWKAISESWRAAELRWQDWSDALLVEFRLQPPHSLLGDESARLVLGHLARTGWSRAPDEAQPSAPRCPSTRAGLRCEEAADHEGPCRAVRLVEQAETWQAAITPPKGTP